MKKGWELQIFLLVIFFIGFIVDIFFIIPTFDYGSDLRLFSLALLWVFLCKLSHFPSTATFKVAIGFLIVLFTYFLFFPTNLAIERVGSWIYLFLTVGVVQQFFEKPKSSARLK